jgi:hypothetical protein
VRARLNSGCIHDQCQHLPSSCFHFATHCRYSFSILAGADYLFGAPRSVGAFAIVPNVWWLLSFVHIFALVAGSILVVNLLIGIVSDAWEQSVGDSLYWRRFGRAAFAVAIYKAKL